MVTVLSLSGCKTVQLEQDQGIIGQLYWLEGNHMPQVIEDDNPAGRSSERNIQRTLLIYELTRLNQLEQTNGLFSEPPTPLVARVTSDKSGQFKVGLPPGNYSVFTLEKEGLFANIFDGEMNVNPVAITSEEWVIINIKIDYKAFY
ncbi:hypothetical protein EL17_05560 [Anditalea andensis]|uniref:Carboxypeptidase regulatory-like domain-containing protein n=2 Tax=Anditalea andensis TaxID=1048983 RepID=A0A074KYV3_9BACT|nr:hypothetical protein EL17_05560 [Anditalea andensis]